MTTVPRYRQLSDALTAAIVDGAHPLGSRLPTEAQLCAEHSLSRGTVRQALRELEEQGLIRRRPGVGTLVVSAAPIVDYAPVVSSSDDIARMVRRTRVVNPAAGEVVADEALARRFGVAAGSRWFRVAGMRVLGSDAGTGAGAAEVLGWSEQYLAADLPESSREVALRGQFDAAEIRSTRIEQEVRAELMPRDIAAALAEEAGSAALVVVRRYFNGERLAAVSVNTHPGARFSVSSALATSAEAASAAPSSAAPD